MSKKYKVGNLNAALQIDLTVQFLKKSRKSGEKVWLSIL